MPRIANLEGRPHAVVPCTLLKEGVLQGSNGRLFYSAAEIERSTSAWAGRVVVRYHPELMSRPVMSGLPEIFNAQKLGFVFNVKFSKGKLTADLWIDVERCKQIDPRVWNAIQREQQMEVSTGLFLETEPRPGVFNGREYDAVTYDYRPDHLAILPDQIGACSVRDGCGLNRNELYANEYEYDEEPLCHA